MRCAHADQDLVRRRWLGHVVDRNASIADNCSFHDVTRLARTTYPGFSDEPRIGRELSPILNWAGSPVSKTLPPFRVVRAHDVREKGQTRPSNVLGRQDLVGVQKRLA
jgi:hypothetical protein